MNPDVKQWRRRSIAWRLGGGFAALVVLIGVSSTFGGWQLKRSGDTLGALLQGEVAASRMALQMEADVGSRGAALRDAVLQDNAAQIRAAMAEAQKLHDSMSGMRKALDAAVGNGAGRTALDAVTKAEPAYEAAMKKVVEAIKGGDSDAARSALTGNDSVAAQRAYLAALHQLAEGQSQAMVQAQEQAGSQQQRSLWALGGLALLSALAAGVLGTWLTRGVVRPAREAIAAAERIATGDLTVPIADAAGDEMAQVLQAMSRMQTALGTLVGQVRHAAENIQVASGEVAAGNADLSSRTEAAASSLQQTSSSMQHLLGNVSQSAEAASQANRLAGTASDVAQRGGAVVEQVVATMDEIHTSSRRIGDIIAVIDGIAFQTNILALNAAVEAARAGEQGRGFAVVASEVRSLAQRSAEAAREIKALIGSSVERVESGSRLVADAGKTMGEIVSSVQRVSDVIGEITGVTSSQTHDIGEINTAVGSLDHMTQQNAALVEQSAAAAESLKEQAQRLAQVVSTFRLAAA